MKDRLISILAPPVFKGDDEKTWRAQVINTLLLNYTVVLFLALAASWLFFENKTASVISIISMYTVNLFTTAMLHRGHVTIAGWLLCAGSFIIACALVSLSGGPSSPMIVLYVCGLVISGLVFGPRGSLMYAISALIFCAILVLLGRTGYAFPKIFPIPPFSGWLLLLIAVGFVLIPLNISLRNFSGAIRLAREEIAERIHIETQMRESEQRYRNFVEQSIDGIWRLAFDEPIPTSLPPEEQVRCIQYTGYIAECNDAIARMYGYDISSQLMGKRLIELYGGEPSLVNTKSTLRLVTENYRSANRETHEVDRLGQPVYFLNNAVGVLENGSLVGIWGTQRDITSQKQAEQALRDSENRNRALLAAIPDLIFEHDRDGTFLNYVPDEQNKHLLLQPEQFLGRRMEDVMPPDIAAESVRAIQQAMDTVEVQKFEYSLPMNEQPRFFEARIIPMGPGRVMSIIRDITEQRRTDQEREELIAQLERQNAELERFTYTVSHDLKSPLITIRGFLGFIERDVEAGKVDRIKADLARIASAGDTMQRLLNELLELSRIGRLMNPPDLIPFSQVVEEALALVQGTLTERNISIQVAEDLPAVYGDRVRLVEVVQNLIDNAAKFMGDQLTPRVEIGCSGSDASGASIFYVRDNGIGIESRFQERIFGLFEKLDPQTEGTGVGLALAKRIVEVHGGRIWVESQGRAQGSTFYFTLKMADKISYTSTT
jgi:PAS domain S-box-containing protein